jgi:hypothetical protein
MVSSTNVHWISHASASPPKPNTLGTLAGAVRYLQMNNERFTPEDISYAEIVANNAHVGGDC